MTIPADFPAKLQCLFRPKRTKVLWGGRGAGRSWGIARWLLLLGVNKPTRVLCCRELQKSIDESVHKVLSDQIVAMGLTAFYEVQANKILGKNGSSFSFEGIKNNSTKIKSYEGIDYCWVEEADKVSRASWGHLIPTIRKKGSEIIMSFNPGLETDYTYKTFVLDKDLVDKGNGLKESNEAIVVKMSYKDNPWFDNTALKPVMEKCKRDDFDEYLHIWEGNCVQVLEGAVYAKQLRKVTEEGRVCKVIYEREFPVDAFWDIGRADCTAIWFAQQVAMQVRVLGYYEDRLQDDVGYYLREIQSRGYVIGTMYLPHDAKAKRLGTKKTIEEQIRGAGYKTHVVPKLSLTDGINAARLILPKCWFDEVECTDGLNQLRWYRYKVIDGQLSNEPMHNDGADAFRYLAIALGSGKSNGTTRVLEGLQRAAESVAKKVAERISNSGGSGPGLGWMN